MTKDMLNNQELLQNALKREEGIIEADPIAVPVNLDLRRMLQEHTGSSVEIFAATCATYADRPALASRTQKLVSTDQGLELTYLPSFTSITYRQLWERTQALATGLHKHEATRVNSGDIVGIYGFASIDYVLFDLACLYLGATSAVLLTSMRQQDLQHVINEGAFTCMVCSYEQLDAVVSVLPRCASVRSLVVMDVCLKDTTQAKRFEAIRNDLMERKPDLQLLTIDEVEAFGRESSLLDPKIPAQSDTLMTLMYTSGSTGSPKGAMLTERVWRTYWQSRFLNAILTFPHIAMCIYPLSHVMGRNAILRGLVHGGVIHFTLKSDMSSLFEDIRLARPTVVELVPRVADLVYQSYRNELLHQGFTIDTAPPKVQEQVMSKMRQNFLGDRVLCSFTGSAPISPECMAFIKTCFQIPVFEYFGSTEGGMYTLDSEIIQNAVTEYKLLEVPELGYRLSDKPYPRGELLLKTTRGVPGYYKNTKATALLYDSEGFLNTGDIVEERSPNHVVWVDRKNNVLKLSQGEFVTIWRLEATFEAASPFIAQIYLYGNSHRAYLLAVLVPAHEAIVKHLGNKPTFVEIKQLLRNELQRIAMAEDLHSYEVPRDFIVENEPFTQENGLLTGVNKPARPQLKEKYGQKLEAIYEQLELQTSFDIAALSSPDVPVTLKLQKALESILGMAFVTIDNDTRFKDLGADSVDAQSLATLLQSICGVSIPVSTILNPGSNLLDLVKFIEKSLAGAPSSRATFQSVHADSGKWIRACDLRLDNFISKTELSEFSKHKNQPLPSNTNIILLTGATGFLGRFLCLEWMEQVSETQGKVYCIIRAHDDQMAFARLREVFESGDEDLLKRFDDLASKHLVVLAGDITRENLGLEPAIYERLAEEVDLIVHPGALVNHMFTYEQLFESNVLGTAELIRLALYKRRKRFDYVSTIGVLSGAKSHGKVPENQGVDALKHEWEKEGNGIYAYGYSASKWASEVLLKDLHEQFDIPVHIYRPSMILPHRRFRGQINVPDMITRLIASLIFTGLAPESFYAEGSSAPPSPHYDGLPVDYIAAAMIDISIATPNDYATYQLSNYHWEDGMSLDAIVHFVESAGYSIKHIGPHQAWFELFRERLMELDESKRQYTSLPILQQWKKPSYMQEQEVVDTTYFESRVQDLKLNGENDIPHLNEDYIHKCLRDMQHLGLIRRPG